ncbi:Pectic enzymes secretion protein OutO [Anaerohalosphaera lusitana]|uniref:Pectic enzymes secretion protein OutO n=1 Tax=Anaerohalosphaera lusitana TaxID=1936003 RepID=A0A1U9NMK8_9BACT|nr:prepilin peptidase [Anaerohalosphaera lusitana]AQT68830.1 Pectic enzymes secretion protein OutO [Anaerohalosphaera lusitana]
MELETIIMIFLFAFGSCIGSFLNVVIYRLPRDKSLVFPPSACPGCDKRIAFYDNIPILSWLLLGGKCRACKQKISPRYIVVELITGLLFLALYVAYFKSGMRRIEIAGDTGFQAFVHGGWFFYLISITLIAAFLAGSAIDLDLWVIPLSLCWFVTAAGFIGSTAAPYIIEANVVRDFHLFPTAGAKTGALAIGSSIGLMISLIGLKLGLLPQSYAFEQDQDADTEIDEESINHRLEAWREIVFLMPVIVLTAVAWIVYRSVPAFQSWCIDITTIPPISGLLGSIWGYIIGAAVVWATRIFGTLGFGKEAMGLGDVHLMGAAGAVIGPVFATVAFFVAPFFGIAWAIYQAFFQKTRQIPYGPFLSLGVFAVMILHDWMVAYWSSRYFAG